MSLLAPTVAMARPLFGGSSEQGVNQTITKSEAERAFLRLVQEAGLPDLTLKAARYDPTRVSRD